MSWIAVSERMPDKSEPVVYRRPNPRHPGRWSVGIAYWTVSQKWLPEAESLLAPQGFTHWMPLAEVDQCCTWGISQTDTGTDLNAIVYIAEQKDPPSNSLKLIALIARQLLQRSDDDYCRECIEVGRRAAQHEESHRKANRTIAGLIQTLKHIEGSAMDIGCSRQVIAEGARKAIDKAEAEFIAQRTDDEVQP